MPVALWIASDFLFHFFFTIPHVERMNTEAELLSSLHEDPSDKLMFKIRNAFKILPAEVNIEQSGFPKNNPSFYPKAKCKLKTKPWQENSKCVNDLRDLNL